MPAHAKQLTEAEQRISELEDELQQAHNRWEIIDSTLQDLKD